jgi:hypothetical protein
VVDKGAKAAYSRAETVWSIRRIEARLNCRRPTPCRTGGDRPCCHITNWRAAKGGNGELQEGRPIAQAALPVRRVTDHLSTWRRKSQRSSIHCPTFEIATNLEGDRCRSRHEAVRPS